MFSAESPSTATAVEPQPERFFPVGNVAPAAPESFHFAPPQPQAEEGFKLPFDPMRLVRAVWNGRWRILIGAAIGLLLGATYALVKAQTRYEVSLQLIKRYSPPTLQAGVNGEPYKPRQFTNSTLASSASSMNVLDRVSRKSSPPVSVFVLKQSIDVKEDKQTDFVTLTLSGFHSPEATVELAKLWSEEVINFTREMQAQESREIRKVIQTQLDNNQAELQRLDGQIIELIGGSGAQLLSSDMQADTFVRSRAEVDARHDAARVELESLSSQLTGLRSELHRQTPAAEELRQARAELEQFRSRYTDQNPLVVERLEKVATLEKEAAKPTIQAAGSGDFSNLASTYIGNQLYLTMVQLESRRNAVEQQLNSLVKQRELFTKSPEKTSQIMELLQKKQMLRTAQSMLLSRMQEVRIYEENAPAYYGIFAPADLDHVVKKTKLMKCAVFTVGGMFLGAFFTLGGVLALGVADRALRTRKEAAAAFDAPLFVSIPSNCPAEKTPVLASKLWSRWLSNTRDRKPRAVWCPVADEANEEIFWQMMLAQAASLLPALLVVDCGETPSPALAALPQASLESAASASSFTTMRYPLSDASLFQTRRLLQIIEERATRGCEVWVRVDGAMREPATSLIKSGRPPLVLATMHSAPTGFFREQAEMLRHSGVEACGVVALNDTALFARRA